MHEVIDNFLTQDKFLKVKNSIMISVESTLTLISFKMQRTVIAFDLLPKLPDHQQVNK